MEEIREMAAESFRSVKSNALWSGDTDASRKGQIDREIVDLVDLLNKDQDLLTRSSCSGRVILVALQSDHNKAGETTVKKKGCEWLLVSHDEVDPVQVWDAVMTSRNQNATNITLKFEPFILHVQCRTVQIAKSLHTIRYNVIKVLYRCTRKVASWIQPLIRFITISLLSSLESGFKNSGLTMGKNGKLILAVRSTHGLEVPLTDDDGILMITRNYVDFVTKLANKKLVLNRTKHRKFFQGCEKLLSAQNTSL